MPFLVALVVVIALNMAGTAIIRGHQDATRKEHQQELADCFNSGRDDCAKRSS